MIAMNDEPGGAPPKLCKDCRYCVPYPDASDQATAMNLARCRRVKRILDVVSGESRMPFCETARTTSDCGPSGNLFEEDLHETVP